MLTQRPCLPTEPSIPQENVFGTWKTACVQFKKPDEEIPFFFEQKTKKDPVCSEGLSRA